jgi:hypothetical protein
MIVRITKAIVPDSWLWFNYCRISEIFVNRYGTESAKHGHWLLANDQKLIALQFSWRLGGSIL